ncbi:NAD(P)-binding protein [Russula ochroleuca]|uniref:NAD(P)-binding protein n=1 Tax=Russula ochroleuca TaxID=152965 RepID=A0A9P5N0V7_9AGAM|nr:NAD(P)-binding protein [Russula ochroleuca]
MEKRIGSFSQLFPPKSTWTAENVPDQTGKVVIITGGNSGIGKETARVLLSNGAKIYIATRSKEKSEAVIEELKRETGKESIFFLQLDLSDLVSVKTAAEEFISRESELHTLYNNGGVYAVIDKLTSQGFDMQFGTNVLGHFYFTKLLHPLLTVTAKNSPQGSVRVVNVSSIGHYVVPPDGIQWSTLSPGDDYLAVGKKIGALKLYGQSKLGNILFSNEFARQYGGEGIVSISVHPGNINTDLARNASAFTKILGRIITYPVSYGAINSLYAGTSPAASELNGKYVTAWARVTLPHQRALDTDLGKKLWEWCEEQVKDV